MKIPKTLTESTIYLSKMFENEKIDYGYGRYLRNNWGLWAGSDLALWFYARNIYHADDMSGIIIESYNRYVRGEEIDFDGQIKFYHRFWKESMGDDHLEKMRKPVMEFIINSRKNKISKILNLTEPD